MLSIVREHRHSRNVSLENGKVVAKPMREQSKVCAEERAPILRCQAIKGGKVRAFSPLDRIFLLCDSFHVLLLKLAAVQSMRANFATPRLLLAGAFAR
jgi:hypothetical protein